MTCSYLHGVNQKKRMNVEGRLNLVDLAGSERLDKSHSTGEALEEAKSMRPGFLDIFDNNSWVGVSKESDA